jgi:hypothetical protein
MIDQLQTTPIRRLTMSKKPKKARVGEKFGRWKVCSVGKCSENCCVQVCFEAKTKDGIECLRIGKNPSALSPGRWMDRLEEAEEKLSALRESVNCRYANVSLRYISRIDGRTTSILHFVNDSGVVEGYMELRTGFVPDDGSMPLGKLSDDGESVTYELGGSTIVASRGWAIPGSF